MADNSGFGYNAAVEDFRQTEYPMLKDSIYLDHAGSTLCAKSTMDSFASEMASVLYGNPHSASWSSQLSTSRIEDVRLRLLDFFHANPEEYDLVFVANATAGVKLVVEGMRSLPQGFSYVYHQACHTSLVGVRGEATRSVCINDDELGEWLNGAASAEFATDTRSTLLSYSAQSHLDGARYPLSRSKLLRGQHNGALAQVFTLLDAASLSATSQLDLSDPDFAADFVVLSLYKIFGFPDLGALIVRRSAGGIFDHRKYFGGGTVDMAVCGKEQWHIPKAHFLHERLEDGTLPFHSIIALDSALSAHKKLFGSMAQVGAHTSYLTKELLEGLRRLTHGNGQSVCTIYSGKDGATSNLGFGPVVSFNLKDSSGAWISLGEFEKLANLKNIHVRTGSVCSPGGVASVLDLAPWEMRRNFSAGFRCGSDNDIMHGKPTGVIRASLGAMSTRDDVTKLVTFIQEYFREDTPSGSPFGALADPNVRASLRVKSITVFPIKSCGGFTVPPHVRWEVRPEGLAWDREWCLVHRGSGQALSQKRYSKMALIEPTLDLERGVLHVEFRGRRSNTTHDYLTIPLSSHASLFETPSCDLTSRVCGENVSVMQCLSEEVNNFFTEALGVPCALARFPPGGHGLKSRLAKARMQRHQRGGHVRKPADVLADMPSPPDSDVEKQPEEKILLSNESPILMVNTSSVAALNRDIEAKGGTAVPETAFRGNIVVENTQGEDASLEYAEDFWESITIGCQSFKLMGACQRCQMVCVNQVTGEKHQEPFLTLAKTRRYDGKVYFGAHMRHDPAKGQDERDGQRPTIQVGEDVFVHEMI